jgi:hypothetical protein
MLLKDVTDVSDITERFYEYSLEYARICSNMLEYARIFAYRTDMNLIGRDGWTDAQTTLMYAEVYSPESGRCITSFETICGAQCV